MKSIPSIRFKQRINRGLRKLGYEIVSTNLRFRMPVELSDAERTIITDVMDKNLTMNSFNRLVVTALACKYVVENEIEGDYVESGVWRGGNAVVAASLFKHYGSSKKVWLFDTFTGSPEPGDLDQNFKGEAAAPLFAKTRRNGFNDWCYSSLDEVRNNFSSRALLDSRVNFVSGDITSTLHTETLPDQIAVLVLDTDWYEPRKVELEVLYPRLSIGGCLSLDYGAWKGNKTAVDEYFKDRSGRPLFFFTDPAGRVAVKHAK